MIKDVKKIISKEDERRICFCDTCNIEIQDVTETDLIQNSKALLVVGFMSPPSHFCSIKCLQLYVAHLKEMTD